MPKEEWGVKRLCPNCATRFYDLQRDPMTCPACGSEFDVETLTATKGKSARTEKAKPAAAAAVAAPDMGDDADDSVIEDDDSDAGGIEDELLEDDEEETVDLEDIADVPDEDDET